MSLSLLLSPQYELTLVRRFLHIRIVDGNVICHKKSFYRKGLLTKYIMQLLLVVIFW